MHARTISVLLVLGLLVIGSGPVRAQGSPFTGGMPATPTIEAVQAQLDLIANDQALDTPARESAQAALSAALADLRRASDAAKQTLSLRALESQAPEKLESIRAELALPPAPAETLDASIPLAQLEQELSQASAALQASRKLAADLQAETSLRGERRGVIPERIAALGAQLADLHPPVQGENEPPVVWEARRTQFLAQKAAIEGEIQSLRAELASYDARQQLLPARRDLAQRRIVEGERRVESLQNAVSLRRQSEAEQAAREAQRLRREAARQHPVLQSYAAETERRASSRLGTGSDSERIDNATRSVTKTRSTRADLDARFTSVVQRIEASGLGRATGLQLRRLYELMEDPLELSRDLRRTRRTLDDAEYDLLELQDERSDELSDIDRVARSLVAQAGLSEGDPASAEFEGAARELATARRDLLDQSIADQIRFRDQLRVLETEQRELLTSTRQRRAYIEERILWVRSIDRDQEPSLGSFRDAFAWLMDPSAWSHVFGVTAASVSRTLPTTLLGALIVLLLWVLGIRGRRGLHQLSGLVARYRTDRFAYTLAAFGLTTLIATPLPLAIYALGWLLGRPQDQSELGMGLGSAMRIGALRLFPLLLLYHATRAQGLTEAHFRWPASQTRPLRRSLRWFMPIALLTTVLTLTLDSGAPEPVNATIGRVIATIGLVALAVFLQRALRSHSAPAGQFIEGVTPGIVYRFRRLWRPLLVAFPLVLVALSWLGFHYTAIRLEARFVETLLLVLALLLSDALLLRWLFLVRRRVAVEDARRRREQGQGEPDPSPSGAKPAAPAPPIDEDRIDLPAISAQTRQLFRAGVVVSFVLGLVVIWSEALPALRMLDRVQLWPSVELVSATSASQVESAGAQSPQPEIVAPDEAAPTLVPLPAGGASGEGSQTPDAPTVITLADLGLSLVILIATWLAFRNVPGLIEIILLQRLPLDTGSRYALSTTLRYLIVILGVVVAFNTIGVGWGKVQWLAAALTFGLAFGLQEVFANFVSGLIILAERPIRIGDTVTVGGVNGTVTRIRMRATTIADWDCKELIIPNKTFITSDVINWTLSDSNLRVRIQVGVSYESDVGQVERVLYRLAGVAPLVLRDPEPQVVFKNFGDSTLDFELRVYIANIDHLIPVQHELRNAITHAFRAEGIEIAFPQRDIHIRSVADPAPGVIAPGREPPPAPPEPASE